MHFVHVFADVVSLSIKLELEELHKFKLEQLHLVWVLELGVVASQLLICHDAV